STTAMDGGSAGVTGSGSSTTAMDGGSAGVTGSGSSTTAMDGGSAGAVGSGSSKNLEGLSRVKLIAKILGCTFFSAIRALIRWSPEKDIPKIVHA
ncbi:MAG: hypothetical protein U1D70_18060, partial [Methylobacter sp.]|nr:hypothetical protein [Methylobacter sp.]